MPEVIHDETQSETVTEQRTVPSPKNVPISPALHERLIELGWTPPQSHFEDREDPA